MKPVLRIWRPRCRAQPHIVIQTLRHWHRCSNTRPMWTTWQYHPYGMHLTDPTIADQLTHMVVHRARPNSGSRLENSAVTLDCIAQDAPFLNGKRWLLAKHVFAYLSRHHRHKGVPVVRRRNHHSINVIPSDNFSKIIVSSAILITVLLVYHITGFVAMIGIDIANGNSLSICVTEERPQIHPNSVTAHTDETQCYPIARSDAARFTQCRGGNNVWK